MTCKFNLPVSPSPQSTLFYGGDEEGQGAKSFYAFWDSITDVLLAFLNSPSLLFNLNNLFYILLFPSF